MRHPFSFNLDDDTKRRLDALRATAKIGEATFSRAAVMRAAVALGLEVLEARARAATGSTNTAPTPRAA